MNTRALTKSDLNEMVTENLADLRTLLASIPDERWDEPSLCDGWRVRDVVGHLLAGVTIPVPVLLGKIAAGGFRVDHVIGRVSRETADRPVAELRAQFDEATGKKLGGISGMEPVKPQLADNVTHVYDIAVPLGIEPGIPAERAAAVLDILPKINMWKSKSRAKGLRLVATDIDWSFGDGPEVRGTASALITSLGGRSQLADTLTGDGAATLRDRAAG